MSETVAYVPVAGDDGRVIKGWLCLLGLEKSAFLGLYLILYGAAVWSLIPLGLMGLSGLGAWSFLRG